MRHPSTQLPPRPAITLPRVGAVLGAMLTCLAARSAEASSFEGRLAAGPSYMWNDTQIDGNESSGPALSIQLDAGVRLLPPLAVHASVVYDHSSWLELQSLLGRHDGSMLGFGLGATLHLTDVVVGATVGGQFTSFPQINDPTTTYQAGLGPFVSLTAGYLWSLAAGTNIGLHAFFRARRSPDETLSFVYDPVGYQAGLALSFGLDGEPLLGP